MPRKGNSPRMHKILIVDDDPIIRNLLKQILEVFQESGIKLLAAENGEVALEIIKKEKPDMVFLDVMMPKMNGFEVCHIVKSNKEIQHTFLIMLTAKGQEIDKQKAKETGADYYITKPFNIDEIVKKVTDILGIQPA
jgi:two-component system, OmpR family, alkaline phosphatase synthesis response regulator PhoP